MVPEESFVPRKRKKTVKTGMKLARQYECNLLRIYKIKKQPESKMQKSRLVKSDKVRSYVYTENSN